VGPTCQCTSNAYQGDIALVFEWSRQGGIAYVCRQAVSNAVKPKELATVFRPAELVSNDNVTLVGAARAAEIVVNVLLPAVFALVTGEIESPPGAIRLKNRSVELYASHPKLADNSVTKEAQIALGIDYVVPKITGAMDQQGPIVLYREMFRHGWRINSRYSPEK
jgi:hypothetical protein